MTAMITAAQHRHPKESTYYAICAVFSVIVYVALLIGTMGMILVAVLPMLFVSWFYGLFFRAGIFGNAIRISERQFPELHQMLRTTSEELGLAQAPEAFVVNGNGVLNAFAIRFLGGRFVVLYASTIDMALRRQAKDELRAVIAHELAHHAAGHVSLFRNILIKPAMLIPYLGFAYSRACEYTADRIACVVVGDGAIVGRALVSLAHGSETLASQVDLQVFAEQEASIPGFAGYINEIYSTHPRMTRRVKAAQEYAASLR
jgi:Zn-dependent protease with chaperone function